MSCNLCPLKCNIDKSKTAGFCGTDSQIKIAKYYLHKFEEPVISGTNGSGTVFFCGCSLKCVFCQNYELSRVLRGKTVSVKELSDIFKSLEDMGAHNINLVTPTQYSDKIIEALDIYKPSIPILYNTHGYENVEILKELNKYVDIYLPDMKFFDEKVSFRYTGKSDYFEVAKKAVEFMINSKQLLFGEDGLLKQGVIVRHLVLPQNVSDSLKIIDWFKTVKEKAYINVMSQYTPFGKIENFKELQRKITKREYDTVIDYLISCGIENAFYQKKISADTVYIPSWDY